MRSAAATLIVLSLAAPAGAQQQESRAPAQEKPSAAAPAVDVDRLPLNLNRIQRQLKHSADLEQRQGLNLRYTLQIYGTAPPLDLFPPGESLTSGPVPNSAPTHQDMINQATPQEFRAPAMDFSALLRWLQDRNKKK